MTRRDVISEAADRCMKELYFYAYPKVSWDDFVQQNKEYNENSETLRPYEFYYLPEEIFKSIVEKYLYAYRIPPEIKDNIETLISYFNDPIRDKYVEKETDKYGNYHPGYRSYEHFTPLKEIIGENAFTKVKDYMKEASNFYRWDGDEQAFKYTIYLGASPNSNRERVIENWKKYRNQDIEINEQQILNEYYGEDY